LEYILEVLYKDLTEENSCNMIVHQVNCKSIGDNDISGFAHNLFEKYHELNVYKTIPIKERCLGENYIQNFKDMYVCNMFAQYNGGEFNDNSTNDTRKDRELYFKQCLDGLLIYLNDNEFVNYDNFIIGMPYGIGCMRAKGDWYNYNKMIEDFNEKLPINMKVVYFRWIS
jgi:hypothetical protein